VARWPCRIDRAQAKYLSAPTVRRPSAPVVDRAAVFADYGLIKRVVKGRGRAQIVDSRANRSNQDILPPDYVGLEVPAATDVPSSCVIESVGDALRFRREPELRAILEGAGIASRGLKITTCYFGLGASVVATALEIAGFDPVLVYPGSLVEYAVREGLVRLS
jgi:3-mercaptopyruvate sulfurtransferase SseA